MLFRQLRQFRRFKKDVIYDLCVPPQGLDYYGMSKTEAQANFEWFLKVIPERADYLSKRCAEDMKLPLDTFDFSLESLIPIWEWFIKTAKVEKKRKKEISAMKRAYGYLGKSFMNDETFSVATQFILRDIGMYVGKVFTDHYDNIKWELLTKPKNDFFFNHPVLVGFVMEQYDPPFHDSMDPIHMVEVQAARILSNRSTSLDLYKIMKQWTAYVPIVDD